MDNFCEHTIFAVMESKIERLSRALELTSTEDLNRVVPTKVWEGDEKLKGYIMGLSGFDIFIARAIGDSFYEHTIFAVTKSKIERLSRALELTSMEDLNRVAPTEVWEGDEKLKGYIMVGRILSKKAYRFDVFRSTIQSIFNPIKGMDVEKLDGGRFLFIFHHAIDYQRILKGGPWAFEKNLLIMRELGELDYLNTCDLNSCDFHVQVGGIPFSKRTKTMAKVLGNQIGHFLESV